MKSAAAGSVVALAVLSGCGPAEPPLSGGKSVQHWLQALQHRDPKHRQEAVIKLGNAGASDAAVLPALVGALKDSDARVRCEAILAVLKCGPSAQEAVPALTEVMHHDKDTKVRSYAAKAVEKLKGTQ
jgi:HEAT repeat protein